MPTPVEIGGVRYVTAADLLREVGVTRQTLWRWRQQGRIPAGHRYRDRLLLFTSTEVEAIREFAGRVAPASLTEGPNAPAEALEHDDSRDE